MDIEATQLQQEQAKILVNIRFQWILLNIILPILPTILAGLVRFLFINKMSISLIDPSGILFTSIMICMLLIASATKANDPHLSNSIKTMFGLFAMIAMFCFAVYIFLQLGIEYASGFYPDKNVSTNDATAFSALIGNIDLGLKIIDKLRILGLLVFVFTTLAALVNMQRHKLWKEI